LTVTGLAKESKTPTGPLPAIKGRQEGPFACHFLRGGKGVTTRVTIPKSAR